MTTEAQIPVSLLEQMADALTAAKGLYFNKCMRRSKTFVAVKWDGPEGLNSVADKIDDALASYAATHVMGFQQRVSAACDTLFEGDPTDVPERLARFFEESNETCQALGMTREDAHQLVDYTYGRLIGDPAKEVGSVMFTLAAVCVYADIDMMGSAEADLEKLQRPETITRIRAKRSTRHGRGPLPGFDLTGDLAVALSTATEGE